MKIEISRPIKNEFNYTTVALPRSINSFYEIYSYSGRGDFLNAVIRFNSDRVDFQMEVDGNTIADISLDDLNELLGYDDDNGTRACFNYSNDKKSIEINFGMPLEFRESIRFLARADSNTTNRDLLGYQITFTEFNEAV